MFTKEKIYRKDTDCKGTKSNSTCSVLELKTKSDDVSYILGFVEFDDKGDYHEKKQLEALKRELQKIEEDVLIITYVHGWFHNADIDDDNLESFQELLSEVASWENSEKSPSHALGKKRKIIGVYIGWRGLSFSFWSGGLLTFWGRKGVAEKIGNNGSILEVFLYLEQLKKEKNKKGGEKGEKEGGEREGEEEGRSRLILVGHSFGGLITYTSLYSELKKRSIYDGFGDIVVLVNPAVEAEKFSHLFEDKALAYETKGWQPPLMLVLSSENDWAVGHAFSWSKSVSHFFSEKDSNTDNYKEQRQKTAIGFFKSYRTHKLEAGPVSGLVDKTEKDIWIKLRETWGLEKINQFYFLHRMRLVREYCVRPFPYWVVKVDRGIMSGHSDIWNKNVTSFVKSALLISIEKADYDLQARNNAISTLKKAVKGDSIEKINPTGMPSYFDENAFFKLLKESDLSSPNVQEYLKQKFSEEKIGMQDSFKKSIMALIK